MLLYCTDLGLVVVTGGRTLHLTDLTVDDLLQDSAPLARLSAHAATAQEIDGGTPQVLLAPIGSQDVWAAGVTYYRSRDARMDDVREIEEAIDLRSNRSQSRRTSDGRTLGSIVTVTPRASASSTTSIQIAASSGSIGQKPPNCKTSRLAGSAAVSPTRGESMVRRPIEVVAAHSWLVERHHRQRRRRDDALREQRLHARLVQVARAGRCRTPSSLIGQR